MLKGFSLTAFLSVTDAGRARSFYRDTLGLSLQREDNFALVFDAAGVMLRISLVKELTPQPFTVLGWQVTDAAATARDLIAAGIVLERYPWLMQDDSSLWHAPGGAKVGWFKDPFNNLLSITEMPAAAAAE